MVYNNELLLYENDKDDKTIQRTSSPVKQSLPNRNDKIEKCMDEGKDYAAIGNTQKGSRVAIESESDSEPENESDMEIVEVSEADFYDFEKDKEEECFFAGQVWAVYDEDGMPRFYARIKEVLSPNFKVRVTWLGFVPRNQDEINWNHGNLSVACGKFVHEKSESTEDLALGMFSHKVDLESDVSTESYKIFPRKSETWALFKNWSITWSCNPDKNRKHEYEYVEVLSDYSEELGVEVAYLIKIKGFVSLYKHTVKDGVTSFRIPTNELLRFSHKVPSFRTTGKEHGDVRAGYFELDPASSPSNGEEIPYPINVKVKVEISGAKANDSFKSPSEKTFQEPTQNKNTYEKSSCDGLAIHPVEKTSSGSHQVMSHGSDTSTMVTDLKKVSDSICMYSRIEVSSKELTEETSYKMTMTEHLDENDALQRGNSESGEAPRLSNGCCKKKTCNDNVNSPAEKTLNGQLKSQNGLDIVSLPSNLEGISKTNAAVCSSEEKPPRTENGCLRENEICPRKGEVWALSCSEFSDKPEYEMVEVLEETAEMVKVLVLKQIADKRTIFRGHRNGGRELIMEIPQGELTKFSHQVPAFRLTDDVWELNPGTIFPCEKGLLNGNDKSQKRKNRKKTAAADKRRGDRNANESEAKFGTETGKDQESFELTEPELYDFNRDKRKECFEVGQVWAIYDHLDGMPRFYALIKKIYSHSFKMKITFLKPDRLDDQDGIDWTRDGLPVACGKFDPEKTGKTDYISMFSHTVNCEKHSNTDSYIIYPRKGETWAFFRNWNVKRTSNPDKDISYLYEYVEVLSDYIEDLGINVAYLVKIKGSVSLFKRTITNGMVSFQITPNELLRFSHRVPSYRTTGREREGASEGYFQLDPASLPENLEEISDSIDIGANVESLDSKKVGSSSTPKEKRCKPDKINKVKSVDAKNDSVSNSTAKKRRLMLKKRKNLDENNTLSIWSSRTENGSPSLSNWCFKRERSLKRVRRNCSDHLKIGDDSVLRNRGALICEVDTNKMAKKIVSDSININTDIVVHTPSSPSQDDPCQILSPPTTYQHVPCEFPDATLYNFEEDKAHEKFKPGQVWAMYCDLDSFPKYYVLIKKVDSLPDFKLHAQWLKPCTTPKGVIQWLDSDMPVCCGTFIRGEDAEFDDTAYFSHQLRLVTTNNDKFEIYPKKGEVWALYKNFNPAMSCSNLSKCEYDMVVVLDDQVRWTIVLVLQRVSSCMGTVFMAQRIDGHELIMAIPRFDLFRFSHQVPAIHMTKEIYGNLQGCWVLDPKSADISFSSSN